jgi:hypothetical protein
MATTPWLTSDDLIDMVKKRISFPISQNTLSEEDILKFASYELFDSQVPAIMEYHEEFFVFTEKISLENDKTHYQIPERAIGMTLRDVFLRSYDGNLREMTRIAPENKSYFQQAGSTNNDIYRFYIENDDIVLSNKNIFPAGQSLDVSYYLRPNSLVKNDRAAIAKNFFKILKIENSTISNGNSVQIGANILVVGVDFIKGATNNSTSSNLQAALTLKNINCTVSENQIIIKTKLQKTTFETSNSEGFKFNDGIGIEFHTLPNHIVNESVIDFLQTKGGHRSYKLSYELPLDSVSGNTITFPKDIVPSNFVIGDYICLENESIIPQIPSDLHSLLAEKTCARILMSIGDNEGLQVSSAKINELEKRQGTLVDNRVEGAPIKIVNKNSLLRLQKKTRRW